MRAIGYVRVSTEEQGISGLGLESQRISIQEEAARRGWELAGIFEDVASGRRTNGRPGLKAALAALDSGEAETLVALKLDRLSRSLRDLIELMDQSTRKGWSLLTLDLRVDTTSPHGKAMARMAGVFAELERDLIAERTKAALTVKKAQGVKLGRPIVLSDEVRSRIRRMHRRGTSLAEIARRLNAEGVPTAHGGRAWHASTVRTILHAGD